jgi:hypothetical protein
MSERRPGEPLGDVSGVFLTEARVQYVHPHGVILAGCASVD